MTYPKPTKQHPSRTLRLTIGFVMSLIFSTNSIDAFAQSVCLPSPRLLTTMPMGAQAGSEIEVTLSGDSIDDASELVFSHPGITAKPKLDDAGKVVPKRYVVTIAADCPAGIHEARVMTPLGLSSSRVFSVDTVAEVVQSEPATSPEMALPVAINSIVNATMPVRGVNHYRFEAKKDQRVIVDCAARGIDSKLNAVVIIADAAGRDLLVERRGDLLDFVAPEDGQYIVKVHELTFKGGGEYFYRLAIRELPAGERPQRMAGTEEVNAFSWPPVGLSQEAKVAEVEPNDGKGDGQASSVQTITLPCDIAGTFFPAADVDVFEFTAKKGETWWVEVASERLGLPTDPTMLVQRVVESVEDGSKTESLVDVIELADIPSPVKVSGNNYAYDGPPYNAGTSDILGKIEIPEDGRYRVQLLDAFGGTRSDIRNRYRMIIRKAEPDFALVAWALHMGLRNGDRNALSKPMSLRPGATMALEVVAFRRDGFAGDIELSMQELPDGVFAQGLKIPAGKSRGIMLVTADEGAPAGWANATFVGQAEIDGKAISRPCRLASMAWPVKDAWSEIPSPRLVGDVAVSVGSAEVAPLTIQPSADAPIEVVAGESVTIPLTHRRRSEFSGATVAMQTMGGGFESHPKFDLPLNDDHSEVTLDLAKLKTAPGDYWIAFYGSAVAKYSPASLAPDSPATDSVAAEKLTSEPAKKPSTTDIADIVVSKPIAIRVLPAEKK
ncbi:serine protease [Novipirellula sp. SH528]|uniref:serine protease n=1 Tax=Novipirellula sp. SH528 TaxID=3454466 RepID=UPI003F9F6F3A